MCFCLGVRYFPNPTVGLGRVPAAVTLAVCSLAFVRFGVYFFPNRVRDLSMCCFCPPKLVVVLSCLVACRPYEVVSTRQRCTRNLGLTRGGRVCARTGFLRQLVSGFRTESETNLGLNARHAKRARSLRFLAKQKFRQQKIFNCENCLNCGGGGGGGGVNNNFPSHTTSTSQPWVPHCNHLFSHFVCFGQVVSLSLFRVSIHIVLYPKRRLCFICVNTNIHEEYIHYLCPQQQHVYML